jgi:alcohol dehydrogenase class IV
VFLGQKKTAPRVHDAFKIIFNILREAKRNPEAYLPEENMTYESLVKGDAEGNAILARMVNERLKIDKN